MKRIAKSTLALAACCIALVGCSKKSNANEKNLSLPPPLDERVIGDDDGSFTPSDEQQKWFALADEAPESDFAYELTEDYEGVIIKSYKGAGAHIRIPAEIQGVPVVELGEHAFPYTSKVVTVVIPDSIKKIGRGAFSNCKFLENIKFPKSVTSIPDSLFYGCESLAQFVIPETVTNIESSAFMSSGLVSIYIPDTVTSFESPDVLGKIGDSYSIFAFCKKLESVRMPPSMKKIPSSMFSDCESLDTVNLPDGITEIGKGAFKNCTSLTWLNIPNSVTAIREEAFDGIRLTVIEIPDSVTELECTFSTCSALKELHLPNSLAKIPNELFHQYGAIYDATRPKYLQKVNIPASIQQIGFRGFSELANLSELEIPDSITEIEWLDRDKEEINSAFAGCPSLPLATQKRLKQLGYPGQFN